MTDESLAIIVALTDPAMPRLVARLARFAEEAGPSGEVLLVDASGTPNAAELAFLYPHVRVIPRPIGELAPSLWREGLLATDADLVAFTTAQMLPQRGWIEALRARISATGAAGVGGSIEPGSKLSATDQAVALLRYANYFPSVNESVSRRAGLALPDHGSRQGKPYPTVKEGHEVVHAAHSRLLSRGERRGSSDSSRVIEPPGDNALYRRDRLMAVRSSWIDGFWEVDVHQALRQRGDTLAMAGLAIVAFEGGIGLRSMVVQRFRHARRYGLGRSKGLAMPARLARIASAPLVPPLLCGRIIQRLRSRGMAMAPWIAALPALVCLATAWAIGEALGTWQAQAIRSDHPRHKPTKRRIREVA